jgi:hypothetical protein
VNSHGDAGWKGCNLEIASCQWHQTPIEGYISQPPNIKELHDNRGNIYWVGTKE